MTLTEEIMDHEDDLLVFDLMESKLAFTRKVYLMLLCQTALYSSSILYVWNSADFQKFIRYNIWTLWIAITLTGISMYAIYCYRQIGRRWPFNYFLLAIFSLAASYCFAGVTNFVEPAIVFIASAAIFAMSLGLTIYSYIAKGDIAYNKGVMFASFAVMPLSFLMFLLIPMHRLAVAVSGMIAILAAIYVIYETHQIIDGEEKEVTKEEHILGLVSLYVDVMHVVFDLLEKLPRRTKK